MKKVNIIILVTLTMFASIQSFAQLSAEQKLQRINASYSIVSGRQPAAGEIEHWKKQADLTVQQLVDHHLQYSGKEQSFKTDIINRSYLHALGRPATGDEIKYWSQGINSYNTLMKNHVTWLQSNPAEYEKVIIRSYDKVFGASNSPTRAAEVAWWKKQNVYSYVILVQCHNDYISRNKKGGGTTISSTVSSIMTALPLNNIVAREVRSLMELASTNPVLAQGANGIQSMLGDFLPFFKF